MSPVALLGHQKCTKIAGGWGSLQCSSDHLAGFKELTSKALTSKGRGREMRGTPKWSMPRAPGTLPQPLHSVQTSLIPDIILRASDNGTLYYIEQLLHRTRAVVDWMRAKRSITKSQLHASVYCHNTLCYNHRINWASIGLFRTHCSSFHRRTFIKCIMVIIMIRQEFRLIVSQCCHKHD